MMVDETLKDRIRALETQNRELNAYAHSIAHALKAPVAATTILLEVVRRVEGENLTEKAAECLNKIDGLQNRMNKTIQQLLLLAEMEPPLEGTPVETQPVLQVVLNELVPSAEGHNIDIQIEPDLPAVLAQPTLLAQVLSNLISNAIKYTGHHNPNPTVCIRAFQVERMVRYEVQDNGIGIKPANQKQIFEPFTRFDPHQAEGSGFGLYFVRNIIARLGGQLGVSSRRGQGSLFWFTLPCAQQKLKDKGSTVLCSPRQISIQQ